MTILITAILDAGRSAIDIALFTFLSLMIVTFSLMRYLEGMNSLRWLASKADPPFRLFGLNCPAVRHARDAEPPETAGRTRLDLAVRGGSAIAGYRQHGRITIASPPSSILWHDRCRAGPRRSTTERRAWRFRRQSRHRNLTSAATLYINANIDGADLYFGDGRDAQGDGEIGGTAIEIMRGMHANLRARKAC